MENPAWQAARARPTASIVLPTPGGPRRASRSASRSCPEPPSGAGRVSAGAGPAVWGRDGNDRPGPHRRHLHAWSPTARRSGGPRWPRTGSVGDHDLAEIGPTDTTWAVDVRGEGAWPPRSLFILRHLCARGARLDHLKLTRAGEMLRHPLRTSRFGGLDPRLTTWPRSPHRGGHHPAVAHGAPDSPADAALARWRAWRVPRSPGLGPADVMPGGDPRHVRGFRPTQLFSCPGRVVDVGAFPTVTHSTPRGWPRQPSPAGSWLGYRGVEGAVGDGRRSRRSGTR